MRVQAAAFPSMTDDGVLHRMYGSRRYGAWVMGDGVSAAELARELARELTADPVTGGAAGEGAGWKGETTEGMRQPCRPALTLWPCPWGPLRSGSQVPPFCCCLVGQGGAVVGNPARHQADDRCQFGEPGTHEVTGLKLAAFGAVGNQIINGDAGYQQGDEGYDAESVQGQQCVERRFEKTGNKIGAAEQ